MHETGPETVPATGPAEVGPDTSSGGRSGRSAQDGTPSAPSEAAPPGDQPGTLLRTHDTPHRPTAIAFDERGHLWVVDGDHDRIHRFDATGKGLARLENGVPWGAPQGIAVRTRLYVTDGRGARLLALDAKLEQPQTLLEAPATGPDGVRAPTRVDVGARGIAVVDPGQGRVMRRSTGDWRPVGEAVLVRPADVALDGGDRMYVLDDARRSVEVFDGRDQHVATIGGPGDDTFVDPVALCVHGAFLFVADPGAQAVRRLALDGSSRGAFAPEGGSTIGGHLGFVRDLAVSPDGRRLAVSEPGQHRVREFDLGDPEAPWPAMPPIVRPWRRLGPPGWDGQRLVVADAASRRLLCIDGHDAPQPPTTRVLEGVVIDAAGVDLEPGGARAFVCDRATGTLCVVDVRGAGSIEQRVELERRRIADAEGNVLATLARPLDLIDVACSTGRTYVLCAANRCLIELDAALEPRRIHATFQLPLRRPVAVAATADGRAYVVDEVQGMLVGVDADGTPLEPRGRGRLARPTDATLDTEGGVWVVERATSHLHRFAPDGTRTEHRTELGGAVQGTTVRAVGGGADDTGPLELFVADLGVVLRTDAEGAWSSYEDLGVNDSALDDGAPRELPVYDPAIWAW